MHCYKYKLGDNVVTIRDIKRRYNKEKDFIIPSGTIGTVIYDQLAPDYFDNNATFQNGGQVVAVSFEGIPGADLYNMNVSKRTIACGHYVAARDLALLEGAESKPVASLFDWSIS